MIARRGLIMFAGLFVLVLAIGWTPDAGLGTAKM